MTDFELEGRTISPRKNPHARLVPVEQAEDRMEQERQSRIDEFEVRAGLIQGQEGPPVSARAGLNDQWRMVANDDEEPGAALDRLRAQLRNRR